MKLTPTQTVLLIVVSLSFSMTYIDSTILAIALPTIQNTFNSNSELVLWVVNIYMLMRAILVFASGRLSDIFGHIRTFYIGLILFCLSSMGCALALNISWLIVCRSLQGVGATLIFVPGMSIITSGFPEGQIGKKIGFVLSIGLGSMAAGPLIGGLIVKFLSWQWIFYINTIVSIIALALALPVIGQQRKLTSTDQFDWAGFILSALFTLFATLAFENSNSWGWFSPKFITSILIAITTLIVFLFIQLKKKEPLVDLKLFVLPNFLPGCLIASFVQVAVLLMIFLGIFLQNALGYSPMIAGLLLLPMVGVGMIFSNVGGYLGDKFGEKFPLVLGTGSITLGFVITLFLYQNVSYYTLLPLFIFSGMGMFMISGPVRTAMLAKTPKNQHGMSNSILTGMRSIISVIGFAITSAIIINVEFFQAKTKLLLLIPSITTKQIHGILGILSHSTESKSLIEQYNPAIQSIIKEVVLTSYVNAFFWALVFVGLLIIISLFLAIFLIKGKKSLAYEAQTSLQEVVS